MKKLIQVLSLSCIVSFSATAQAYYDAVELRKLPTVSVAGKLIFAKKDSVKLVEILKKYKPDATTYAALALEFRDNPFIGLPTINSQSRQDAVFNISGINSPKAAIKSIGSINVTNIANALSDIMIEHAKQELTIAFFDRFKDFSDKNPEFQTLFPKTTDALANLLSFKYPEMLPTLRAAFLNDLSLIAYRFDDLLLLPRYQDFLNELPEVAIVVRSLQLMQDLENGTSNAADIIQEFSEFPEWDSSQDRIKPIGSVLKISALFSESVRNQNNKDIWVSSRELKELFVDNTTFLIYMGLIYQQAKMDNLVLYYFKKGKLESVKVSEMLVKNKPSINTLQNKVYDFFKVANDVNLALKRIKDNPSPSNDDYYAYINTSLDVIDYGFSIAEWIGKDTMNIRKYMTIIRKSNELYRSAYTENYNQVVANSFDLLTTFRELIPEKPADKERQEKLEKMTDFLEKTKPYALFMANVVEAQSSDDVKAAIENVILPVGSSGIKKYTQCNFSVQSYLGAFYSTSNDETSFGTWSDRFGVTAPIGLSLTPGFLSMKKYGSVSLFVPLFDLGAIVDYKLKIDSVSTGSGSSAVVSKDYTVELGQIFSPGVFVVYGFFADLPLALGFGAQYGPGLSKIESDGTTVVGNPSWRWNFFLAVDLPMLTIKNKSKVK